MIAVCCMSDEYAAGGVRKMLSSVCEELRFVGAYSTDVPLGKDILFVHCHLWYAVCRPVHLSRGKKEGGGAHYLMAVLCHHSRNVIAVVRPV